MSLRLILILALGFLLLSCGKKVARDHESRDLSSAEALLNARDFEAAILKLRSMHEQDPQNKRISEKYLHALAGGAGFESLKILKMSDDVQKAIKAMDENPSSDARADLERALRPLPLLSERQQTHLEEAIALYNELRLSSETAGSYNNFKWGTLHLYRMAVTAKLIAGEVSAATPEGHSADILEIERAVLKRFPTMGLDLFLAHKLYENSFDLVKKFTTVITKAIARFAGDKGFRIKIRSSYSSQKDFYQGLVEDNREAVAKILTKIFRVYQDQSRLTGDEKKTAALFQLSLENLQKGQDEIHEKLKSIFTREIQDDFKAALSKVVSEGDAGGIKDFLNSDREDIQSIVTTYQVFTGNLSETDVPEHLKDRVKILQEEVEAILRQ